MQASLSPGRRRKKPDVPAPSPPEGRDWSALPGDILVGVFLKLGPREIMRGADMVCTAWRRGAVGEPALWRRVDLTTVPARSTRLWKAMARAAVDRAAGQCEAYRGPCDNDFLLYLIERATSLKSIHLSHDDTREVVLKVAQLNKLPLLEDVDVSLSYLTCPRLKELRMSFTRNSDSNYDDNIGGFYQEKCEIPVMGELRLTAILDSCPVLESLNVPGGDYLITSRMDEKLRAKCAKLKNVTLPYDSDEEYYEESDLEDGYESDFLEESNQASAGIVIRTTMVWLSSLSEEAELMACREGLQLALQWSQKPAVHETDCANCVTTMKWKGVVVRI
ncbi:hypothetical protein EJB05_09656, partial [Eragrostis curvula]